MRLKKLLPFSVLLLTSFMLTAQTNEKTNAAITEQLAKFDIKAGNIESTPLTGIFEVQTDNGILYTNKDASYFFYGKLFAAEKNDIVDLTAKSQSKINLALMKEANIDKEFISYPAKNEKYVINVFTDTSCGYCVKLHSEMAKYNELGISVRYLAFPRRGESSPNLEQMSAIWCAKDQNQAMDLAKTGKFKETSKDCINTVRHHYQLGAQIGISGTPAILLEDGSIISGYLPPAQLLQRLEQKG